MMLHKFVFAIILSLQSTVRSLRINPGLPQTVDNNPSKIHYLRISKTGSTSTLSSLDEVKDKMECQGIQIHKHDFTAQDLGNNSIGFAIMRDPCDRFISQTFHLKKKLGKEFFQDPAA
eukprot:gnl/MRDRNA2_/MRDRNA2_222019_c0_seq1.p1 gnl/MRDRNA2_/MRDRNA2_222019_c0~~gnl/MRDRNA2_/MRDRNA2_222019_c0_seq1.p1  ORF type:complete len:118 (+),score=21.18 gnl/MRDRNA2_/MRDRNA2_222019_c0_seq1:124-477(+)